MPRIYDEFGEELTARDVLGDDELEEYGRQRAARRGPKAARTPIVGPDPFLVEETHDAAR